MNTEDDETLFDGSPRYIIKSFKRSTFLSFAKYDKQFCELTILFQNGSKYKYYGVDQVTVDEMIRLEEKEESVGTYFRNYIAKGRFRYERIE
jgi:hypothetical protein